jgi:Sec-independent protein translocase protein TatA
MSFSGMLFLILLGLIIFGPTKLSQVGKQIGRVLAELKSFTRDFKSQLEIEIGEATRLEKIAPPFLPQSQLPTETGPSLLETDTFGGEHARVEGFHG